MLSTILPVSYIIFALLLNVLILMQKEKGAGMMTTEGASRTLFGSQGSTSFITKLTMIIAGLFLATCLGLNLLYSGAPSEDAITLPEPTSSTRTQSTKEAKKGS